MYREHDDFFEGDDDFFERDDPFSHTTVGDDGPFDTANILRVAKSQYDPANYAKLEVLLDPFENVTKIELDQILESHDLPALIGGFNNIKKPKQKETKKEQTTEPDFEPPMRGGFDRAALGLNSVSSRHSGRELYNVIDSLLPGEGALRVHNALTMLGEDPNQKISKCNISEFTRVMLDSGANIGELKEFVEAL